jgi:hypothetical protein
MELLARPLPKLLMDPEPVVLLAALSAISADVTPNPALPPLLPPRIAGESPWLELTQLHADTASPAGVADPAALPQDRGSIIVERSPSELRLNGTPVPNPAPVELSLKPGLYRIGPAGAEREIMVKPDARLRLPLH